MSDSAVDVPVREKVTGERLEAVWPAARDRLVRHLVRTGVDADGAEDILQEVALRAMATSVEFSDLDDFCRWAYRVAHNLRIDQIRLETRVMPVRELPERPTDQDVASEVEHRIDLNRTLRAMASLRESDRAALVEAIQGSGPSTRMTAVRLAVRRHRARTRLQRALGGVAAMVAAFRTMRSTAHHTAPGMTAVALLVPASLLLAPHPGSVADPDGAGRPPLTTPVYQTVAAPAPAPAAPAPARAPVTRRATAQTDEDSAVRTRPRRINPARKPPVPIPPDNTVDQQCLSHEAHLPQGQHHYWSYCSESEKLAMVLRTLDETMDSLPEVR